MKRRDHCRLWILAAAALALPGAAFAQDCADCHEEVVADASVHAGFDCSDCHAGYDEDLHPEEMAGAEPACSDCHEAGDEVAAGAHAGEVACSDCHGAGHGILAASDRDSPVSPLQQIATCAGCHDDDEGELIDRYLVSAHGFALLKSGLVSAPACSGCHGAHDVRPSSDRDSAVSFNHAPETCGACHQFILDAWRDESAHGLAWAEGDTGAPNCVTCHASHEVHRPTGRGERIASPENCGDCHGGPYSTYRDSFHGKVTELGFARGAVCSDCHTPHQNLPASDPRSSVHPDALGETCGTCHEGASGGFLSFDPHSDPHDPERSRPVHYVWLFMTTLLVSVFGFFGVHHLLWLQRALVGLRRGEFAAHRRREGPYVRRFAKVHIATHVAVVVSFLVLAATGLPLKYHYAEWAQALTSVPGTVAVIRVVHRLAAVVTFSYALFHVGYVLHRASQQGGHSVFWGWRSMVPGRKDLEDLWHNLRYFLYLAPAPRLDRWSYWEKFDYFAVFWGVPIIGGSGLVLWFPEFFTRFLPGWVLNAAFVIHSDEALLATGFIFTFHFFNTHLRPESFPMDPVIFTGRMPLERFREERPLEYERLLASGELDQRLVDAPDEHQLRRAHIFGLIAVAVGLLLVVAIFTSMLLY